MTPGAEPDDAPSAGPLRRGLLRGALLGLACSAGGALVLVVLPGGGGRSLGLLVFSALVGLMAAPAFALEHWAGPGGRGRHAAAAVLTVLLVAVGAYVALLQSFYVKGAQAGGLEGGLAGVGDALRETLSGLGEVTRVLGSLAVPFGVLAFVRLRRLRLGAQVAAMLAAWAALAAAVGLAVPSDGGRTFAWLLTAVESLALPPLSVAADALERRLWPPERQA